MANGPAVVAEAALGLGVAALELRRQGVRLETATTPAAGAPALDYTPAQAQQMRPLYDIAAGEPNLPVALAAVVLWQGAIALAEELYYRGFLQSVGIMIIGYPLRSAGMDAEAIRTAGW